MTALARAAAVALRRYGAALRDAAWDAAETRREAVAALEALRDALPAGIARGDAACMVQAFGFVIAGPTADDCDRWATAWDAWAEAAS